MTDILIAILAILFVLGVAINIHEFGHFAVAKLFGMRVEAYSFFGLGPRLFGFKIGNTDYRVSAIPLGAYVKLYGDEATAPLEGGNSKDVETFLDERNIGAAEEGKGAASHVVPKEELYELRPRWQKFLVMLGGPFMNFVLAISVPFAIGLFYGIPAAPAPVIGFVKPDGAAANAGIQVGDRIVAFAGVDNPSWERIVDEGLLQPEKPITLKVERSGQQLPLTIVPTKITRSGQSAGVLEMSTDDGSDPVVVGKFQPGMPAASSGLKRGDLVVSVNGKTVKNPKEMKDMVGEAKDQPIKLSVLRNGERLEIVTNAVEKDGEWLIGIGFDSSVLDNFEATSIGGALKWAVDLNVRTLRLTGAALGQVGTGQRSARDTVSGPIGIGQAIVGTVFDQGFFGLLFILTAISLSLGVMNLLPIPMLDGGQIMVLGIEKVLSWFGRTLSMVAKERIQLTGLAIVLLLVVTVTFFDVSRLFSK